MHGFDIYVKVHNLIVAPAKVVLGPLIRSPSSTVVCINGVSAVGSCTLGTVNGACVVEVATTESSASNECPSAPCSGMAFNITYVVRQATGSTPIDYPSAATCSPSSVPATNICISVTDNTGTPVGENIETATYGAPSPIFLSVVVGVEGTLYWSGMYGNACCWSSWKSLAGASPSAPYLCSSGRGGVELVVRGYDNSIYHKSFSNGTWQSTWDKNPTGVTIDQSVCAVQGTNMFVIVRGVTSNIWATTFNLTTRSWASAWTDLQGSSPSPPAVTVIPVSQIFPTSVDLVIRGSNNGIYHKAFVSGNWSTSWDTPGPPAMFATIDTPAFSAVVGGIGSFLEVVVRGTDSGLYFARGSSGGISGFSPLSGSSPVAPTITSDSVGTFHLVVRGFDNTVVEKNEDGHFQLPKLLGYILEQFWWGGKRPTSCGDIRIDLRSYR